MCNLYTARKSAAEVAAVFGARIPTQFNVADEVVPGYPGMVVREQVGERILQSMTWGFPLPMKSKRTGLPIKPKPINNIADLTSGMWRNLAPKPSSRCLIPVTEFAEAEGEKGSKTRTWIRVKDQPIFAWAGLWRESAEWGAVYSGLMTDCNEAIRPVHNRGRAIRGSSGNHRRGSCCDQRAGAMGLRAAYVEGPRGQGSCFRRGADRAAGCPANDRLPGAPPY